MNNGNRLGNEDGRPSGWIEELPCQYEDGLGPLTFWQDKPVAFFLHALLIDKGIYFTEQQKVLTQFLLDHLGDYTKIRFGFLYPSESKAIYVIESNAILVDLHLINPSTLEIYSSDVETHLRNIDHFIEVLLHECCHAIEAPGIESNLKKNNNKPWISRLYYAPITEAERVFEKTVSQLLSVVHKKYPIEALEIRRAMNGVPNSHFDPKYYPLYNTSEHTVGCLTNPSYQELMRTLTLTGETLSDNVLGIYTGTSNTVLYQTLLAFHQYAIQGVAYKYVGGKDKIESIHRFGGEIRYKPNGVGIKVGSKVIIKINEVSHEGVICSFPNISTHGKNIIGIRYGEKQYTTVSIDSVKSRNPQLSYHL